MYTVVEKNVMLSLSKHDVLLFVFDNYVHFLRSLQLPVKPTKMEHTPLKLRQTEYADLAYLFRFQLDKEANYLAAFTPKHYDNEAAYLEKLTKILSDPTKTMRTILLDEVIVGSIAKFVLDGKAEITYWIDGQHWGKGIAAAALQAFLTIENTRPLFGRVVFDNIGSQKVLEKCGFIKIGTDRGFANARLTEVEEFIYKLT